MKKLLALDYGGRLGGGQKYNRMLVDLLDNYYLVKVKSKWFKGRPVKRFGIPDYVYFGDSRSVLLAPLFRMFGIKTIHCIHNPGAYEKLGGVLCYILRKYVKTFVTILFTPWDVPPWLDMDSFTGIPYEKTGAFHIVLPAMTRVGKGHEDLYQATQGLNCMVTYAEKLSHRELMSELAGADIVVLPYKREGLPLVALEAMAIGTPIIAYNRCGLERLITDMETGLLAEQDSIPSLRATIEFAIRNPQILEYLRVNALKLASTFTVTNTTQKLIDVVINKL